MQADNIIEKAKKLGIDTGNSVNQVDKLRYIAQQLGVDDLAELEDALDSMLQEDIETLDDVSGYEDIETLDDSRVKEDQKREKFGEREYREAQDEHGVYDKNYYAKKGKELDDKVSSLEEKKAQDKKEVLKKNDQGEKVPTQKKKNIFDKAKDNADLMKAKNDRFLNKINGAKAKAYNVMHPTEALKNKAKGAINKGAKNVGKKAAKGAGKAIATTGKAIGKGVAALVKLIASHPLILVIILIVVFILIIIIMFASTGDNEAALVGYYDRECNFNESTVNLKRCSSSTYESMSLEEYVVGTTYSYIKDKNYSNETIKALMVVLKTNALSIGGYSSSQKSISIDDCSMEYINTANIPSNELSNLQSIYELIKEEIFISESYTSTISSLSSRNSLSINTDILDEMESISNNTYGEILNKIYNSDVNEEEVVENYRDVIFVGDSRTAGMKNYGIVNDNNSVYAGSMGYYWFNGESSSSLEANSYNCKSNAINCVNDKIGNNSTNIVIWLGVNDITNYEKYYEKYYELATNEWSNNYIYVVSVGYVDDNKSQYVKNSDIDTFNNYMKSNINSSGLNNLIYIDLGYDSATMANGTTDGIHYNNSLTKDVYDNVLEKIGSSTNISSTKKIYNLNSYCTYYNLTENETFWWPIGSSEPTEGNIYGGVPSTVNVTSLYGARIIDGKQNNHKGIDIAGACESNVIIATKSGVVTRVNNSCDNNGSYGNNCGGEFGNYVIIEHSDGKESVYAHLYPDSITVSAGDSVEQGEKIGLMGNSGSSLGCHLHFEISINGIKSDPLEIVSAENPRPVNKYILGEVDDNGTTAKENKVAICKSLLNSGFSKNAVAGALVNIQEEGAFRTNNLEDCYEENKCCKNGTYGFCMHQEIRGFGSDAGYTAGVDSGAYPREKFVYDRAGYGLIQWTSSDRKAGLYDHAKSQNKSISALSVQLEYLLVELQKPSYAETYKYLTGNYSAYDIANIFCLDFESPHDENITCPTRAREKSADMLAFVENGCS